MSLTRAGLDRPVPMLGHGGRAVDEGGPCAWGWITHEAEIAVEMTCSSGHDGVVRDVGTGADQAQLKNIG